MRSSARSIVIGGRIYVKKGRDTERETDGEMDGRIKRAWGICQFGLI